MYAFWGYEGPKVTTDACGRLDWVGEYGFLASCVGMVYLRSRSYCEDELDNKNDRIQDIGDRVGEPELG